MINSEAQILQFQSTGQLEPLSVEASADEVTDWLRANRFTAFVKVFEQFTGMWMYQ